MMILAFLSFSVPPRQREDLRLLRSLLCAENMVLPEMLRCSGTVLFLAGYVSVSCD
jgi:hypothetical protein